MYERTVGGVTTRYNWDAGFGLISEENASGTLTRTYVGRAGDIAGSNPSTGAARYYLGDQLGSARRVVDANKNTLLPLLRPRHQPLADTRAAGYCRRDEHV